MGLAHGFTIFHYIYIIYTILYYIYNYIYIYNIVFLYYIIIYYIYYIIYYIYSIVSYIYSMILRVCWSDLAAWRKFRQHSSPRWSHRGGKPFAPSPRTSPSATHAMPSAYISHIWQVSKNGAPQNAVVYHGLSSCKKIIGLVVYAGSISHWNVWNDQMSTMIPFAVCTP